MSSTAIKTARSWTVATSTGRPAVRLPAPHGCRARTGKRSVPSRGASTPKRSCGKAEAQVVVAVRRPAVPGWVIPKLAATVHPVRAFDRSPATVSTRWPNCQLPAPAAFANRYAHEFIRHPIRLLSQRREVFVCTLYVKRMYTSAPPSLQLGTGRGSALRPYRLPLSAPLAVGLAGLADGTAATRKPRQLRRMYGWYP